MKTENIPRPKLCCTVAAIVLACGWLLVRVVAPATMTTAFVSAVGAVGDVPDIPPFEGEVIDELA